MPSFINKPTRVKIIVNDSGQDIVQYDKDGSSVQAVGGEVVWTFDGSQVQTFPYETISAPTSTSLSDLIDQLQIMIDNDTSVTGSSYSFSGARDSVNVTDSYLARPEGALMDDTPFVVPRSGTIWAVSASTSGVETWIAEVRRDTGAGYEVLASLPITAAENGYKNDYGISVDEGDEIALYVNGTNINRPGINVFIR